MIRSLLLLVALLAVSLGCSQEFIAEIGDPLAVGVDGSAPVDGGPHRDASNGGDGSVDPLDGGTSDGSSSFDDGGDLDAAVAAPDGGGGADATANRSDASTNGPPVIDSLVAVPNPAREAESVKLTVGAQDPDDDPAQLRASWTQTPGHGPPVTLSGAGLPTAHFTAPTVSSQVDLSFEAKVCDPSGLCDKKTIAVTVQDSNRTPAAMLTVSPDPANPGDTVTLDGSATTDDDPSLSFSFSQSAGPSVSLAPAGSKARFVAPVFPGDVNLQFTLRVCDPLAQCSTATRNMNILAVGAHVSPSGNDSNRGTKDKPFKTIGKGLATAVKHGLPKVLVDEGDYAESVTMAKGVTVECGYDAAAGWTRGSSASTIKSSLPTAVTFPPGADATLDGCTVRYTGQSTSSTEVALVAVREAAAVLSDCTVDASDAASTGSRAKKTKALSLSRSTGGGKGSCVVSGGSLLGGNGVTSATGVAVGPGMSLTIKDGAEIVGGAAGSGTKSAIGIDVEAKKGQGFANVTITGATVKAGAAADKTSFSAGVQAVGKDTTLEITGTNADGGNAFERRGVLMDDLGGGTIRQSNITVGSNSQAGSTGYGVLTLGITSKYSLDACTVTGGHSPSGTSAAVKVENASPQIATSTLKGAVASPSKYSVGVWVESGTPKLESNALIQGGPAVEGAVGVYVKKSSSIMLWKNAVIRGSDTGSKEAAGVSALQGTVIIDQNVLIVGGAATKVAVGIYSEGAEIRATKNTSIRGTETAAPSPLPDVAYGVLLVPEVTTPQPRGIFSDNALIEGGVASALAVGVQLDFTTAVTFFKNTLRGGAATVSWGLRDGFFNHITTGFSSALDVNNNLIAAHSATVPTSFDPDNTGGVFARGTGGKFTNNRILGGVGDDTYGINLIGVSAHFWNNYISALGTAASSKAYAIHGATVGSAAGKINNNILDSGRKAKDRFAVIEAPLFPLRLLEFKNNDLFPEAGGPNELYQPASGGSVDVSGVNTLRTGYSGNIAVDPQLVDEAGGDFHLKAGSPCKTKGLGTSAGAPAKDMDDQTRPGSQADIGPDQGP